MLEPMLLFFVPIVRRLTGLMQATKMLAELSVVLMHHVEVAWILASAFAPSPMKECSRLALHIIPPLQLNVATPIRLVPLVLASYTPSSEDTKGA